jgi:hypothetical protein
MYASEQIRLHPANIMQAWPDAWHVQHVHAEPPAPAKVASEQRLLGMAQRYIKLAWAQLF